VEKGHVVHRRGNDRTPGVASGRDGAGQVHEVHDTPAEKMAQRIGVVGQGDLGILRSGSAYGAALHGVAHV